jgi:threonylcarbamoyladenosine tRNA methylthiotransferase MtaB
MRRKYTMEFFKERLDRLKEALPGLAITSDVIVGFPGETEAEFMETFNFIKDNRFSELHVFPYSKRTGTPAARMDDQVLENIKNERVHQLIALSDQLAKEYASQFDGEVLDIIPEETNEAGLLVGYTDNYLKVVFEGAEELIGKLVKVKLIKAGYPYNEGQFVRVLNDITELNTESASA